MERVVPAGVRAVCVATCVVVSAVATVATVRVSAVVVVVSATCVVAIVLVVIVAVAVAVAAVGGFLAVTVVVTVVVIGGSVASGTFGRRPSWFLNSTRPHESVIKDGHGATDVNVLPHATRSGQTKPRAKIACEWRVPGKRAESSHGGDPCTERHC